MSRNMENKEDDLQQLERFSEFTVELRPIRISTTNKRN